MVKTLNKILISKEKLLKNLSKFKKKKKNQIQIFFHNDKIQ